MDHKLRELHKYIRALDVLTEATKSFRAFDQLLDTRQDVEVLKLEIQIQTVKQYLLRDENEVYPTLTYISDSQLAANKPLPVPPIKDAFAIEEHPPPPTEDPPPPVGSHPKKFSRSNSIYIDLDDPAHQTQTHAHSLPASFEEHDDFFNQMEKPTFSAPLPVSSSSKCKSEPQSPRYRKSSSSRIRKTSSRREVLFNDLRSSRNKDKEEKEKARSWPKNRRRASARSSRDKEKTPWDIVDNLNQNHQALMQLVKAQEESLNQINQMLNSN